MPGDKDTIELYRCNGRTLVTGRCYVVTDEGNIKHDKRCGCHAEVWKRQSTSRKPRRMSDLRFVLAWSLGSLLGIINAILLLVLIF